MSSTAMQIKKAPRDLSDRIQAAMVRVEELARAEVERYRRVDSRKAERFEAQKAGDFQQSNILREEIEYLENPESGRAERRAAIIELHLLRAEKLEQRIAAIRAQLPEREAKAKSLLSQLEEAESVDLHLQYAREHSMTQTLIGEARDAEVKARLLHRDAEHAIVETSGIVQGANADELVEALMRMPEVLGPSIASIYERIRARRIGSGGEGQRLRMTFYGSKIEFLDWEGLILEPSTRSGVVA